MTSLRAEVRGIPAANDLESLQRVHPGFKATAKLGEFLEFRFSQSF
jgi:hypothetical protein